MGGRVGRDRIRADRDANVDVIVEGIEVFGLTGGPRDARGKGGRDGILHGGLGKLLFFNGEFKFSAGESVRRGKLIAVKLKLLTAVRRFAQ